MRKLAPTVAGLLSAVLFGAAVPFSKSLLQQLSPFQLAGLLYLGACLAVAPIACTQPGLASLWPTGRATRHQLGGAIVAGGVVAPVLLLLALRHASAASVSLWLNLELVATATLGHFCFDDYATRRTWYGVVAMVAAGCMLSIAEPAGPLAVLLAAAACICWGLDNNLTALIADVTPPQVVFFKGLIAGAVNLSIGVWLDPYPGSWQLTAMALVVGGLSYGASIALYISCARSLGAIRAQMIFAGAPFFGLALSVVVLAESISGAQMLAAAGFAGALWIVLSERHLHQHSHQPLAHSHFHQHDDLHHQHPHHDQPPTLGHTHWHEHPALIHAHPHWPDLHHRHHHSGPDDSPGQTRADGDIAK